MPSENSFETFPKIDTREESAVLENASPALRKVLECVTRKAMEHAPQ